MKIYYLYCKQNLRKIDLITVRSLILEGREELMPDWARKNQRCSCYARVEDLIVVIPCNTW